MKPSEPVVPVRLGNCGGDVIERGDCVGGTVSKDGLGGDQPRLIEMETIEPLPGVAVLSLAAFPQFARVR